ncbi:MAG: succinate--CoA ligase subunit alpha [Minisyncoccia bacterium]
MSILIDKNTTALVQGITGKEGSRAAQGMLQYGTQVVAGVTPGKGGMKTEEGVPVYESVQEALQAHPEINASLIAIPGKFVRAAAEESIAARIPLINILSERIPIADVAYILVLAKKAGVTIVGPSSVGILSPGKGKIGSIGSGGLAEKIFASGPVGVISKSGGMTAEISRILTDAGIGQSTAIGIGGDPLIGLDFLDAALLFESDPETRALVIFGEVGGVYEERLAEALAAGTITKPVVALIAGAFAEHLPFDTQLGHAGAIIEGGRGSASVKIQKLTAAGAHLAETPEDIVGILKKLL